MSIANQILDSKYLGHYLDRTPDGRTRISRQWEITADKTNPSELEEILFQQYGIPDGVDGSRYAFTPNSEKVFCNAYLTEQYVRSQGRGLSPNLYTLTKVYEEADDTLRLLTTPTYRSDENGRRYASSNYVVLTSAWKDEGKSLAGKVGVTTFSEEDNTFVLSEEESASEGFVLTTVAREWAEVTEAPQQIGKTDHFRGPDGILRHTQRFIQLASAKEELGEIEVDVLEGTGALLFTQSSESTEVVRTITKEYVEPGVLSKSEEKSNNGALTIRTVQTFGVVAETPDSFVEVSVTETNPDGYPTRTYRFAKGEGQIGQREGRLHGGRLTTQQIEWLSGPDVVSNPVPPPEGFFDEPYEVDVSEEAGYKRWRVTYVKGEGAVNITQRKRHNGKLILTTVEFVTEPDAEKPATEPVDLYGAEVGSSSQRRQGYTLWSIEYASGEGEVGRSVSNRIKDIVEVVDVRYLTSVDVEAAPAVDPAPGTLADVSWEDQDGYKVWTLRYVKVSAGGVIFDETDERNGSKLKIRTIRRINSQPDSPGAGWALVSSGKTERDLWTEYHAAYAHGEGEVGRTETKELDDAITYTTVRSLGGARIVAPSEFDFGREERDGHTLWTSTGIKVNIADLTPHVEKRNGGKLTLTTSRKINAKPAPVGTEISYRVREQRGYKIHEVVGALGEGEIGRQVRNSIKDVVTATDVRVLTDLAQTAPPKPIPDSDPVNYDFEDRDGHRLWTLRYIDIKGDGIISDDEQLRNNKKLKIRTIRRVNQEPESPGGPEGGWVLIEDGKVEREFWTEYTARFAQGSGLIQDDIEKRNKGKLILYTRQQLSKEGDEPDTPGATIGGTVVEIERRKSEADGYVIVTKRWAEGRGVISRQIRPREQGLRTETVVYLNDEGLNPQADPPAGIVLAEDTVEDNGVTRHTVIRMQSLSGDDPTSNIALAYGTLARFIYPGRAKPIVTDQAFGTGIGSVTKRSYDVFLSPPVETQVEATVEIKYQLSSAIDIPADAPLWSPKEGATINAVWLGWSEHPKSKVEALRGYRSEGQKLEWSSAPSGWRYSVFGDRVYNNSSGFVEVTGGPENPDEKTYTLEADIEPAFVGKDGTVYYRQVRVYATIPKQEALPV